MASLHHSRKKYHSLEIWAVKLRLPLIDEDMLEVIKTACSEYTTKHENKRATGQATLFLI